MTIKNTSRRPESLSWFEYWDVNPENPLGVVRGTQAPVYDPATRTLSVAQLVDPQDAAPLSIFAAALRGPGQRRRRRHAGVLRLRLARRPRRGRRRPSHRRARARQPRRRTGRAMFAFRSPLRLAPGRSVTLRYAYGYGHPAQIAPLVARWRRARDPFDASERAWAAFVPQASFGPRWRWLSRELQWDAYMVRSGATYEECAGHHIISQGGYYQYGLDFQGAFRDPLQHALPMIYADPSLAREVILYSAGEQPQSIGQVPYARIQNCARFDLGTSDDLDLWLLWTAAEYGLATRDTSFFDTQVPWADGGTGTLWAHLKRAVAHQESQRSLHGLYLAGVTGDWSDLLTEFARHDRVHARRRAGRLRLSAPGRARRRARRRRIRPVAPRHGRRAATRRRGPVGAARLVLARVQPAQPVRNRRDLRRATAMGDPRGDTERRAGLDPGRQHPPLPDRDRRSRRPLPDRLLAIAGRRRPRHHRAQHRLRGRGRQPRRVRGRQLVRGRRLADVGAGHARSRAAGGARRRLE